MAVNGTAIPRGGRGAEEDRAAALRLNGYSEDGSGEEPIIGKSLAPFSGDAALNDKVTAMVLTKRKQEESVDDGAIHQRLYLH